MQTLVHFDKVTKRYGSATAVDALDLQIEAGKFVTLLGPSGCGKSTTLRLLGGFETPDAGRVMLAGKDVTHLPPNRRNVNTVFQDYALFPHMNVARNIAFGPELQGRPQAEIERLVTELLQLVQLEDFADRMPGQLSGGQRQRIALMRALAPDPQILLLDEPLSALDAKLRQQMQIELKSIQERTGKTFLFVTHDQEEALSMSDVVVVMYEGRIEQIGDPRTLYNDPQSRFVANFIGDTNLLDCKVLALEGDELTLDWGGSPVRAGRGARPAPGQRATVAVRPESMRLSGPPRQGDPGWLPGAIRHRVFKGTHTVLEIDVGAGRSLSAHAGAAALDQFDGNAVWVGWPAAAATVLRG
jgi:spermidine/putrescine transport system ATP-binding protein